MQRGLFCGAFADPLAESLFDVISCYFPIDFTPVSLFFYKTY